MTEKEKITELTKEVARLKALLKIHADPEISSAKKVFISLMQELPPETQVMKYMSEVLTAEQVIDSLISGQPEGLQYISDCLRIVRDMQKRDIEKRNVK